MKWSYQSYDVTPTSTHLTKDLIAEVLRDHYAAYNPLCIHTSIQNSKDGTCTLLVYFTSDIKNVSELPQVYKKSPSGFSITIPPSVPADKIPEKLENIPLDPDQIFTSFAWINGFPDDGDFTGIVQEWIHWD